MERMATVTRLHTVTKGHRSLRTVVPIWIIEHYNLKHGDTLKWKMQSIDGEIKVMLEPEAKNDSESKK